MARVRPRAIATMKAGEPVTIAGRIRADESVVGIFSRSEWVVCVAEVNELLCDGATFRLEGRYREQHRRDFVAFDPTGATLIRVAAAAIAGRLVTGNFRGPEQHLRRFAAEHKLDGQIGWSERVLGDGFDVVVQGTPRLEPGVGPGARSGGYRDLPMRLVVEATKITTS